MKSFVHKTAVKVIKKSVQSHHAYSQCGISFKNLFQVKLELFYFVDYVCYTPLADYFKGIKEVQPNVLTFGLEA
jgi:hypothetical protein